MSELFVIAVTVTYGEREEFLTRVIAAGQSEAIARMVAVDNGAAWPLRDTLKAKFGGFVDIVEMGRNTGSAGGYAAGIKRALDLGADYVWLLDDDNRPGSGCLDALLEAHQQLQSNNEDRLVAVQASRSSHRADRRAASMQILARRNAFLGFHVADVPRNIWQRSPWESTEERGGSPATIDVAVAPYGGLLLHRPVLEAIGLPRADFVLYADDLEFTYRITRKGGRIVKVTKAALEDLEHSWDRGDGSPSSFGILLNRGSDLQVYYGVRNRAYFEYHDLRTDRWIFYFNRGMHLAILGLMALFAGKTKRYRLVLNAARDGLAERLGQHPEFPLQESFEKEPTLDAGS